MVDAMGERAGHVGVDTGMGWYCRHCGYDLRSLPTSRCPECGRNFDPANPRTYRKQPYRSWPRYAKRAAMGVGAILLVGVVLAAIWGWFYWGWYSERQALIALRLDPNDPNFVRYEPMVSTWPQEHLGSAGFVLDRVTVIDLQGRIDLFGFRPPDHPIPLADLTPLAQFTNLRDLSMEYSHVTDLRPLAGLTKLERLIACDTPIADIAPLGGLTKLQMLSLEGTSVKDLTALSRLTALRRLFLDHTRVADLTPLAGLTELEWLGVADTSVTDLTPLAGLPKLVCLSASRTGVRDLTPLAGLRALGGLYLDNTLVADLAPLAGLKGLEHVSLPKETVTNAQVKEIQRALPRCTIRRE